MTWTLAAEGKSLSDLKAVVADRDMPKGTPVKWVMDFKIPGVAKAFDAFGAEWTFKPFVPNDFELKDVSEEEGKGVVHMEAKGAFIFLALAFVRANWIRLVIGGFLLTAVIKLIQMFVQLPPIAQWGLLIIILIAIGVIGGIYLMTKVRGP